jgi:tetratricopeptide (TPR) repeat protein
MDPKPSVTLSHNAPRGSRIPASRRARLALLAALALVAGAGVAGAVAWRSHGAASAPAVTGRPFPTPPPVAIRLPGAPVSFDDAAAVLRAARARLPAADVGIAVARIMVDYQRDRAAAIAALERLPQNRPVVTFNLGVAQYWNGDLTGATRSFEATRRLDPYGFYGSRADGLLFRGQELPGYPPYVPPVPASRVPLATLEAAARAHPGSAEAWLRLAAALGQSPRFGARLDAIRAARRALALDPTGIDARVAVAVLSFDKANPAATMGVLGPMSANEPTNPEIRFHMGMVLFWIKQFDDAAAQMRQVLADAPGAPYAPIARVFERCLTSRTSCNALTAAGG